MLVLWHKASAHNRSLVDRVTVGSIFLVYSIHPPRRADAQGGLCEGLNSFLPGGQGREVLSRRDRSVILHFPLCGWCSARHLSCDPSFRELCELIPSFHCCYCLLGGVRGRHWKMVWLHSSVIFLVFLLDGFVFVGHIRAKGYYDRFDFGLNWIWKWIKSPSRRLLTADLFAHSLTSLLQGIRF